MLALCSRTCLVMMTTTKTITNSNMLPFTDNKVIRSIPCLLLLLLVLLVLLLLIVALVLTVGTVEAEGNNSI